jgi:hypothetical protein
MQHNEIKKLVRKYNFVSTAWLSLFLLVSIGANWLLTNSNIEQHAELGLEHASSYQGFIWGAIILGLNVVLQLFFYSLERILLKINSSVVAD